MKKHTKELKYDYIDASDAKELTHVQSALIERLTQTRKPREWNILLNRILEIERELTLMEIDN